MGQLFSNNGKTTLAGPVNTVTTSIVVVDASKFPVITGGNTFKATLENLNRTAVEIVEVTQVVGNTLTVVRAQEGTVATAFDAGSFVEGRLTAGWLNATGTKLGTVSATELSYLNGVTSGIQGQIDGKESRITTLAVSKGGTGVSTLTGLVKGNGTSAMTAAVAGTDYVIPSGSITGNAATATTLQTARTINGVSFNGSANITINAVDSTARIASSEKGVANGVAALGSDGKVPSAQLPSYVDDVLEFTNLAGFPTTGDSGKIYVALDTNKTYRWAGSVYVYITSGAVDSVAGKTGVVTLVKADIGLSNVDNTSDANKPISTAVQTALNTKLTSTSYTASDVLAKIKTVDGPGSGLDADLLDGQQGSWYAPKDSPEFTGAPTTTTPTTGDSSTRIASTAYVNAEIANDAVTKTSNTGAAALPAGTVAQRPTGINGLIRYNSDFDQFEGFKSGSWSGLGGATGGAGNPAFYENDTTITSDYTITAGKNAMSAGPISINDGVTVTIPDGSTWTVV